MAILKFVNAIDRGEPIQLYNLGKMQRDFTYIDDIIDGTIRAIDYKTSFEIFNLGKGHPEPLEDMVQYLEKALGKKALIEKLPMQIGEITKTFADINKARELLNFSPRNSLKEGIEKTISWYHSTCTKN
jgi:UDP-glucuronate 4-epimerase